MSEELKQCPFCGGEAVLLKPDESATIYRVGCNCAHCIGANAVWHAYTSEAEAIAAWNARAERTCHAIAIYNMHDEWCADECSMCGYEWYEDEPNYCPNCGAKVIEEKGKGNDGE